MRSVLVVGGAGYIGSHACKALAASGLRPVTFDNLSTGHAEFVKWGPLVRADIHDREAIEGAIREHDVDAVMHFAALAAVGESVVEPERYYRNNVAGTLSLLEAMRATGVGEIVFSSTCAIYGQPGVERIAETTPKNPTNPYGRTKLICEGMLEDFGRAYGIRAIALRYFNASGADPDGEIGEFRAVETHLIPRAIMYLQGHIDDFRVFGTDYATPDGTAVRDYIHVCDLADAHVAALEMLRAGHGSDAFNLGVGVGRSVLDVLTCVERVSNLKLPVVAGARRPGDPDSLVADAGRAAAAFGFAPTRSDIETIVATAWNWHRKAHPRLEAAG